MSSFLKFAVVQIMSRRNAADSAESMKLIGDTLRSLCNHISQESIYASVSAYVLIVLFSSCATALRNVLLTKTSAQQIVDTSASIASGSESDGQMLERSLMTVLISVLSFDFSVEAYQASNGDNYMLQQWKAAVLIFGKSILTMSNLSNYPSIVHLITTSTLFNWAVCAEHMASASNQAVSRSDQVNFLCNLTEYNLENLISVGNATEIGRFLKSSNAAPAVSIIALLYEILDSPNDSKDVLPSSLAAHFMDKNANLTFLAGSNSKADSSDDIAEDVSLSLELPYARLDELMQSYQHATGVKRLDFRIFAYQLQTCKMEWKEYSKQHSSTAVSDIQGLTKALNLTSLQYLLSTLADKNVLWSLLDTLYDPPPIVQKQKAAADTSNIQVVSNSAPSSLFVRQLKLVRIYATLLSILPCMAISSEDPGVGQNINVTDLLNTLAFSRPQEPLVGRLWHMIRNDLSVCAVFESMARMSGDEKQLYSVMNIVSAAASAGVTVQFLVDSVYFVLVLFFSVLAHQLTAVDDQELLESHRILSGDDLTYLMKWMKQVLHNMYWLEPLFDTNTSFCEPLQNKASVPILRKSLLKMQLLCAVTKVFNQLCSRNERRPFLSTDVWQWPPLGPSELALSGGQGDTLGMATGELDTRIQEEDSDSVDGAFVMKNPRSRAVLTFIPQVIPFHQRVSIFQSLLEKDKASVFSADGGGGLAAAMGLQSRAVRIEVHRDNIVEDAYNALNNVPPVKFKGRVQVEFISGQGYREAGIDGGGLFKEFLDVFAKAAFDPMFGLFLPTSGQLLTPNPASHIITNHLQYFQFIGKMLGKALYERVLLESEFAGGFLNILLGRSNSLDDLCYLDEQLHRSLLQLRQFAAEGGNLESLELFFEASRSEFGAVKVLEIIPGGSNIRVEKSNIHAYIHRLSHFKQNVEISDQCRAFLHGFRSMIPLEWIRMFSTRELQLLISGDRRPIDIADMKRNIHYASGYHESQPYIQAFWRIVSEMNPEDQGHLLKFVTSCSRQPLLGFAQLHPKFCIQQVPMYSSPPQAGVDEEPRESPRLPSAATCMNLLKLPKYDSETMLEEKLLYAIRSNSGFELS
eukprot:gene23528-31881_t